MAFTFLCLPHFVPLESRFIPLKPQKAAFRPLFHSLPAPFRTLRAPAAIGPDGKFYPNPADDDPPEASEDSAHGVSKFQQIHRQAERAQKLQEEEFKKHQSTFLAALADVEDAPDNPTSMDSENPGDDLFSDIDKAIAMKRKEFVKQGLLKPNPRKAKAVSNEVVEGIDELEAEEVVDLEEINELQGLKVISEDSDEEGSEKFDDEVSELDGTNHGSSLNSSFDLDFDSYGKTKARIMEPKFKMTLAEILDESKVVPVSVYGNLEIEITGIQHDSRLVSSGDLFVCCVGRKTDGHLYLTEADNERSSSCSGQYPSKNMAVIGITGTNGKTTSSYLIKSMYEAMGLRTGMLNSVAYYVHGDNKLDSPKTTPDAVLVQNLMAKMLHNGTEAVVTETSSHGLATGSCNEVDFDIAVFTNLTRDHVDFHGTEEEYRDAMAKLFSRMVDLDRHRKVVNIDDPHAPFFISQGNPEVPVVTFAMENKNADVHPLKFELSLFETQVLVNTPHGILEISSGLLGKHNIYNILAAVAVGIAVGVPLEDIVRGIEEVDAVPGRCELIDEEQAFGVIVDYAHTPDALSRLLDSVRELGPRRVITVFGCPGEGERGKRPMMTKIATDKSDVTILTSDNPKNEDPLDILDDMLAGVGWTMQDYLKHGENDYYPPLPNGHRIFVHDIRRVAVRAAVAMGEEADMVVAGKGHEAYQIEGDKTEFFDDREECREALQYVDELHQAGIDTSEFPWRLPESH
ncbi:UDP-N-acetylmuramoyl-L-alanyl-D-glutamate--2, 6-diaminopimelate ligase [Quillaja saponaria]|uniref:UDP-N-acetylmuramoyl-L-alanyl-D-glutamate--2,6-diaminopimelate ligase MurE homolog, chloroplastic n=1 Tax=Quillaja saponaria TaxID=32244 RepID=A0AAD7KU19_QUISA|nr:UDP-N-acetylmuramoyl-L-alanyl-D-glutamate--2, 6-diaminopimelate ligase [Quillaja saponaria]